MNSPAPHSPPCAPSPVDSSGDVAHARRSLERAQLAVALAKWPTALVLLRDVLAVLPDDPAALALYGLCLAEQGGPHAAAVDACRRAVESRPYVAAWHAYLGVAYRAAGLGPQAAASFRAALALDPHESRAQRELARLAQQRCWWRRLASCVLQRRATPA